MPSPKARTSPLPLTRPSRTPRPEEASTRSWGMPRCRPRRVLFLVLVAAVFMVGSQSYLGSQQNFTANTFVEINQDGATPFGISEEAGGDQKPGEDPELQESDLEKLLAADSAEGLRFKSQEASLRAQILQVVDPTGGAEAAAEARLQNESPPSPAPPSALPVEVVPETAQRQRQPPADGERESLHSVPTPTKQPLKLLPIIGKAIDPPPPADPAAAAAAVAAAGGITTGVRSGINGIEGGGDPRQAGRTAEQRLHQQPGPNSLTERQQAVVNSMQWAWKGYKGSAWGRDELHPVSQSATDWFGLGLTLIDALDTLWLMGLNEEFNEAREWVASSFHPEMTSKDVNLFETTIRVLGGLLSTYALSGDELFLEKADALATKMLPAFSTPSGIPFSDVNLKSGRAHGPSGGSDSSTSEVTSLQLEWRWLATAIDKPHYSELVTKVNDIVDALPKDHHLVPFYINTNTGHFGSTTLTLGARADSYYEYLLKQWLLGGKSTVTKELRMRTAYEEAMQGVRDKLVGHSTGRLGLTFVGEVTTSGSTDPKMDHLVCFLPGTLALGAAHGATPRGPQYDPKVSGVAGLRTHPDFILAEELMRTCYEGYRAMAAKLAPEIWRFKVEQNGVGEGSDFVVSRRDSHNLLRPETVESLHVLYHLTGNTTYQEWGWEIFKAFERHTKVETGGYTDLESVQEVPPPRRDKMETFFLGETLKYLFLLFGDDDSVLPLDQWVFNTEAHPLPVYSGWGSRVGYP